jgi:hypothetical protein
MTINSNAKKVLCLCTEVRPTMLEPIEPKGLLSSRLCSIQSLPVNLHHSKGEIHQSNSNLADRSLAR